jgi:3-methyladenine DNA glycosylase AlkD
MHPMVKFLTEEMKKAGEPAKATGMQAYMKTDQPFYGVQAGPRRKIFRQAAKSYPVSSRKEYENLILELWKGRYREDMYQALEVAERYTQYRDERSWPLFERLVNSATNWDTLDWIAGKLVNRLVLENRKFEKKLIQWSKSGNFWVRRASLLAHLHHKHETNTRLLSETILSLCHEEEFFIRKAIGCILRDYSYTDPRWVNAFVEKHRDSLSGLSIREALKQIQREEA